MTVCIKVRIYEKIWENYLPDIQSQADVWIWDDSGERPSKEQLAKVDVLIATFITQEDLEIMSALQAIFLYKTGTEKLPVKQITDREIKLYPSHANSEMIAEHAIALAYALTHRIVEFHRDLSNGIWYGNGKSYYWNSFRKMHIGILGYGHIGKEIAIQLKGYELFTLAHRKPIVDEGIMVMHTIPELLMKCDLLFMSLPENESTIHLLTAKEMNLLRGKYIVNTGRANVCDEKCLYEMLKAGLIRGYASDVWPNEPDKKNKARKIMPSAYDFQKLDNVVLSPHCATHAEGGHERYIRDAVKQCCSYLKQQ